MNSCCNNSTTDTVSLGDGVYVWKNGQCSKRMTTLGVILNQFLASFVSPTFPTTITNPDNGFNLVIPSNANNSWQLLRPFGNLATGTVMFPLVTAAADGQEIIITTTLQISTFIIDGNGATKVYGAPGVLAAEDNIKFRFNKTTLSWYKVA